MILEEKQKKLPYSSYIRYKFERPTTKDNHTHQLGLNDGSSEIIRE